MNEAVQHLALDLTGVRVGDPVRFSGKSYIVSRMRLHEEQQRWLETELELLLWPADKEAPATAVELPTGQREVRINGTLWGFVLWDYPNRMHECRVRLTRLHDPDV